MKKVYTGPINAVYRNIWIERARQMDTDEWMWLLPTRYLLQTTRQQLMTNSAGMMQGQLFTFDDIAKRVIEQSGLTVQPLSFYGREKLVEMLLERHRNEAYLAVFQPLFDTPGLSESISRAIGEMKRAGFSVDDAQSLLQTGASNHGDIARQRALAFLFIEYQRAIKREGTHLVDAEEFLTLAADLLEMDSSLLTGLWGNVCTLWVDQFVDFGPLLLRLLRFFVQAVDEVGIYIPFPNTTVDGYPYLRKQVAQTIRLLQSWGFTYEQLDHLSAEDVSRKIQLDWLSKETTHHVSRDSVLGQRARVKTSQPMPVPDGLECFPACSVKREVETVAKEIKRLVIYENVPLHEIALVVRGDSYERYVHEIMRRDGIPLNAPEKISLLETGLGRQLLSFVRLSAFNWEQRDVYALAQGGYFRWQNPPPPGLESMAKSLGITRGFSNWYGGFERLLRRFERPIHDLEHDVGRSKEKVIQAIAWFEEVKQLQDRLNSVTTWAERLREVVRIWEQLDVLGCIRHLWAAHLKKQDVNGYIRDIEAYKRLRETIDELIAIEPIVPHRMKTFWPVFVQELLNTVGRKRVTALRRTEGGVHIFEPSAMRGTSFDTVFVLGLNEGVYPANYREDWLMRDVERMAVHRRKTQLVMSHAHEEMEQLFFEFAINAARKRLILSYISSEADDQALPSRFLEQLKQTFIPGSWLSPERFQDALESRLFACRPDALTSLTEWNHYAMAQWGRGNTSIRWQNDLSRLITHASIEQERREGEYGRWDGFLQSTRVRERLREQFSSERVYSVSWLNDYASCPLYFFFTRVLGVRSLEEQEEFVSALDVGNILHEVLSRLFVRRRNERMDDIPLEEWRETLAVVFAEVMETWEVDRGEMLSSLWRLEKERLWNLLHRWLTYEYERMKGSRFYVSHTEFSFGLPPVDNTDTVSVPNAILLQLTNEPLRLVGRIDRIDHDDEGNFVLYDYKLSVNRYAKCYDMAQTTNFQLPLYAIAYETYLKETNRSGHPVGAGYYSLRPNEQFKKIGLWDKQYISDLGISRRARSGVTDNVSEEARFALKRVEQILTKIREGHFYVGPDDQLNLHYADQAVYRADPVHIKQKAARFDRLHETEGEQDGTNTSTATHD